MNITSTVGYLFLIPLCWSGLWQLEIGCNIVPFFPTSRGTVSRDAHRVPDNARTKNKTNKYATTQSKLHKKNIAPHKDTQKSCWVVAFFCEYSGLADVL